MEKEKLSLCRTCYCMTKTITGKDWAIKGMCGKCRAIKEEE